MLWAEVCIERGKKQVSDVIYDRCDVISRSISIFTAVIWRHVDACVHLYTQCRIALPICAVLSSTVRLGSGNIPAPTHNTDILYNFLGFVWLWSYSCTFRLHNSTPIPLKMSKRWVFMGFLNLWYVGDVVLQTSALPIFMSEYGWGG